MQHKISVLLLCFSLAVFAVPAGAASYVMMQDGDLADVASVIVEVEITDSGFASVTGMPTTDYQVEVTRLIKGSVTGNTLIVRVPGAIRDQGLSLQLDGVPSFRAGNRALLFLNPRFDGTFGIAQLSLGTFHLVNSGTEQVAIRDLRSSVALKLDGSADHRADPLRHAQRFANWLSARAQGLQNSIDYLMTPSDAGLSSASDAFTLLLDSVSGLPTRWLEFQNGGSVTFFAHEGGQPDLPGGGFNEFQTALDLWTNDQGTNIDYRYGGTTTATGGLTDPFDNGELVQAIVFEDPNSNGQFMGAFDCSPNGGGVIAIGGPWFDRTQTHMHQGQEYITIVSADIITNSNSGCFLASGNAASEVFAHELGHTLGFGHSCDGDDRDPNLPPDPNDPQRCIAGSIEDDALMRAFAHGDGRGAVLGVDDLNVADFLYGPITGGGNCTANATTLCLNSDRFQIRAAWRRSNGETGVGTGVELTNDTGYFWFFNSSNVEMVIKLLTGCANNGNYWVFAGGLTNVEVDITVTDTESGLIQTYSNPLNTPFQPIQDTGAFNTCP